MKLNTLINEDTNLSSEQIIDQIRQQRLAPIKTGDVIYLKDDPGFPDQMAIVNVTQNWGGLLHFDGNEVVEIEDTDDAKRFLKDNPSIQERGLRIEVQ